MSATLSSTLAHLFDFHVRSRGQAYFRQDRVRIEQGTADRLTASVRGSRHYEVSVALEDNDDLTFFCSCPYFDSDGPCKHLWAALLAAERTDFLSTITDGRFDDDFDDEDDDDFDDDEDDPFYGLPSFNKPAPPRIPAWKSQLQSLANTTARATPHLQWPAKREVIYIVETGQTADGQLSISINARDRKANGEFSRPVSPKIYRGQVLSLPSLEDRQILSTIAGGIRYIYGSFDSNFTEVPSTAGIPSPLASTLLPVMIRTGRAYLRAPDGSGGLVPLAWDDAGPWQFELELRQPADPKQSKKQNWSVVGILRRNGETIDLGAPALVTRSHVFTNAAAAPLADDASFDWILHLRKTGAIDVPAKELDELIATLLTAPGVPRLNVPEHLRFEEVAVTPRPALRIHQAERPGTNRLHADLSFDYDGRLLPALQQSSGFFDPASRRFLRRDPAAEQAAADLLTEIGVKYRAPTYYQPESGYDIAQTKLPHVVRTLIQAGWHVEADGKIFRRPGDFKIEVSSGVDWFELHGNVQYGELTARLPQLLEALRRGQSMVKLDDGTFGMLPEDWLKRVGMLAGMGTPGDGHIRFQPSQAGLLDALLAAQPEATFDESFARVREQLRAFGGIEPAAQPAGFIGQLRDYQREGLGWMDFLQRFSFGGCLADDMGVGKTAQVLALLERRREAHTNGEPHAPSLVVVPRSLVFNWKEEAARFTPHLRVHDYTGLNRGAPAFTSSDLVLTTYGTLRRDIARLKDIAFDYVILDEAQAVKNAGTASSKAVRLLHARHRLALSGTPVENHLGELWSLFDFLNPGMLGAASVFKLASGTGRTIDDATRSLLSHALRPFILRRTKQQVARELPAKTEQTVYCELGPVQRKLYDELRQHYRDSLLAKIDSVGLAKSKIMVLEALLRLRQAACHPALIDAKRAAVPSAKLESLLEQLREVLDAGHKALVFSQFTSLLAIVRKQLDAERIPYQYLDGQTRDRQACVEQFQNDPDCKLFLISLKAGGLGLNLTAAEYVFLLDPWWNPAVEAQAVDRAHRIGQTKPVFAYRLIARDTVEEKVLELQKSKRALADAIIGEDNARIANLRREDLELLLS